MINIVLYNNKSIPRIAQRAVKCFSNYGEFRTTRDTIWIRGMYMKFTPRMLSLNVFDAKILSEEEIAGCLKNILLGEEVYVSDNCQFHRYINEVNISTDLKVTF